MMLQKIDDLTGSDEAVDSDTPFLAKPKVPRNGEAVYNADEIAAYVSGMRIQPKEETIEDVIRKLSGGHGSVDESMDQSPISEKKLRESLFKEGVKLSGKITIRPNLLGGTPVITGTRIPVYVILDYLSEGYSPKEIIDDFPSLTIDSIQTALEFAAQVIEPEE